MISKIQTCSSMLPNLILLPDCFKVDESVQTGWESGGKNTAIILLVLQNHYQFNVFMKIKYNAEIQIDFFFQPEWEDK